MANSRTASAAPTSLASTPGLTFIGSNVICLPQYSRPRVRNPRGMTLFDSKVVNLVPRMRCVAGEVMTLARGALAADHGKRVILICRSERPQLPAGDWWEIIAVDTDIALCNLHTGQLTGAHGRLSVAPTSHFRRWRPEH